MKKAAIALSVVCVGFIGFSGYTFHQIQAQHNQLEQYRQGFHTRPITTKDGRYGYGVYDKYGNLINVYLPPTEEEYEATRPTRPACDDSSNPWAYNKPLICQ